MQCYTEILPPSGVTHSTRAAFVSSDANNLIVAKASLLQIYDVRVFEESEEAKLVLLAEYALQATVTDIEKVKLVNSKTGADALLIAFRDAKLSLIEWDPTQHSISTISIHYYENHDSLLCPWSPDLKDCPTHLTVDPSSRCAAFNFNFDSLAIIPFHQPADDLALGDDFDDLDDDVQNKSSTTKQVDGRVDLGDKLYAPSFVLPLIALDSGMLQPIAIAFLHEYREPTIGILFSTYATSVNMAPVRKDILTYAVYTLDIEQKASTPLLSVTKLPNDLHRVLAVPAPIGGTLLVGGNELIHIDQGGRANAVGVNEFSKQASSFPMADQPDLKLRLEGCQLHYLDASNGNMLLILADGAFVVISFRIDGRSVSGLVIQKIDSSWTDKIFQSRCSTMTTLGPSHLFLGSEEADSVFISTTQKAHQLKRVTSRAYLDDTNGEIDINEDDERDEDDDDDDDDDDDLYADTDANGKSQQGTLEGSNISLQDHLPCLAPLYDIAVGRPPKRKRDDGRDVVDADPTHSTERLDLVASCNQGVNGSLAFFSRSLRPKVVKRHQLSHFSTAWALSSEPSELESDARPFDDMLVVSTNPHSAETRSSLLSLSASIEERDASDFEKSDRAITTGRLATGSHVVVYAKDVRTYNNEFALDQIYAIVDEDADATAQVTAASVTDTHILILKNDHTLSLLKTDKSGDLDEVDLPENVPTEDVISACLYDDHHDFFHTRRFINRPSTGKTLILAVLTQDGSLSFHPVSNPQVEIFQHGEADFLPTYLSVDFPIPKHWRKRDTLIDFSLCTIGSATCGKPYLIVRNASSDITIYEPYKLPGVEGSFRFVKLSCFMGDSRETYDERGRDDSTAITTASLVPLHDVNGMGVCFVTGKHPSVITRTPSAMPAIHRLDIGPVSHISSFHDSSCNRGFVYVNDESELVFCEIPSDAILDYPGWVIEKVHVGEEISALAFYPRTGSYVLATSSPALFQLPRDDEWHPEWAEDHEKANPNFLPTTRAHSLKLISSTTHSIISRYHFAPDEQVLSVKCMNVEVSEQTHERKDLIVVGTGFAKGENVVTRGFLYLFDIVDVVPHPDIPETDLKLKLVTKEDVRGAVTAISAIGSQGFVLAAQGQKCMVRGLREDNAILPVAFLDMRYYVSVAKELPGTGLAILADAFAGLWLVGYSEEPYKLQLLGKDLENPSVVAAEFMPQDKQLYIISSDGNGDLRILQYDPWNPKTERGSILLHRSTFNTGYFPTLMTLLPRSPTPSEVLTMVSSATRDESDSEDGMQVENGASPPLHKGHQILVATREGALCLITPVAEQTYRRLNTLQTTLTTQLDQACGLNPRAHRQIETDGVGGRAMLDGQVVKRWWHQSSQHKHGLADRVGANMWDVRSDLEAINGGGLGYL